MSDRKQRREARKAADQAEYEASLKRADEATQEQREHPAAMWPMLGVVGYAIDRKKRRS